MGSMAFHLYVRHPSSSFLKAVRRVLIESQDFHHLSVVTMHTHIHGISRGHVGSQNSHLYSVVIKCPFLHPRYHGREPTLPPLPGSNEVDPLTPLYAPEQKGLLKPQDLNKIWSLLIPQMSRFQQTLIPKTRMISKRMKKRPQMPSQNDTDVRIISRISK